MNRMSDDEAKKSGVCNRYSFFRVDDGKKNMAPPAERSTWHQIVGVPLGNDRGPVQGDSVGVAVPWTWPDRSGELTPEDVCAIQDAISAGEWRANSQAKNWAGHAVADALDLDLTEPAARASVKAILKSLIEGDVLRKVDRKDDDTRKFRSFVMAGKRKTGGEILGDGAREW